MRTIPAAWSAVVVASFALLLSHDAEAAPNGSYQQSCPSFGFDGTTLTASCATGVSAFPYITSSLRTAQCSGDISNLMGHLYCAGGIPGSSYVDSCVNVSLENTEPGQISPYALVLHATCSDGLGHWIKNDIMYGFCLDQVANVYGHLSCAWAPSSTALPPSGSYRASCYQPALDNNTLTATCRTISGGWNQTSLADVRPCTRDISNQNGVLTCAM